MRKIGIAFVSGGVLAACLSACGGGSGQGSTGPVAVTPGSPSTPTPSSSSSPTPTPGPAPSYTTYNNLTGDQTFKTACALLDFQGTVPNAFLTFPYGNGSTIALQSATQTYTISLDGKTLTFGPADVDPAAPSTVKAYIKPGEVGNDRFSISGAGFDGAPLQYVRYASIYTSRFGRANLYPCVFGIPTLVTDVPSATTIAFPKLTIGASVYDASSGTVVNYTLNHSTQTFVVDLSALRVDVSIHLIGTPRTGTDVDLGTVTGIATIDPATGRFDGTWSSTDREAIGYFSGAFFGPQGHEMGYAFGFNGRQGGTLAFSSAGTVFGKY